jgi:CHAD domain-containing protein
LRRLRSACSLLRKEVPSPAFEAFGAEAKWLMHVLGPARDWGDDPGHTGRLFDRLQEVACPSVERLIRVLEDKIGRPAEAKFDELLTRRKSWLSRKVDLSFRQPPQVP